MVLRGINVEDNQTTIALPHLRSKVGQGRPNTVCDFHGEEGIVDFPVPFSGRLSLKLRLTEIADREFP